ncbi:archease [Patescibacteria group bacterium]|nr:archease [Patescibacteria group bacterium]MBU2509144.1 archease [Patescibacteria group bacterium]
MKKFEIILHEAEVKIKATALTRAGLLNIALEGMYAAAQPQFVEGAEGVERWFSVEAEEFDLLLIDFLCEALNLSGTNGEAYESVSFSLITDKKAEGTFTGRAVIGFKTQIKTASHKDLEVKKNAQDLWEAVVTFDT